MEAETKWPAILQKTFPNPSYRMKIDLFFIEYSNFTETCFQRSNQHKAFIGSNNGLAPSRLQAIIWSNDGIIYWFITLPQRVNVNADWSKEVIWVW